MASKSSAPWRVAIFEIPPNEEAYLRQSALASQELFFHPEPFKPEYANLAQEAEALSVFIYSRIGASELAQMPKLKLIATRSTGYDHIDLAACRERGITVSNVPFYGENTVAEHTFGLILSLSRHIHRAYVRTIRGDFSLAGLMGFDLKGKTLGIIGAGHIGLHVIRMAKGFGMNILAYDVRQDHFLAEVLDFSYAPLEQLLAQSDVISLHAPYNARTHHLINRENLKLVKRGAILINTSRGGLVDTSALVWALDEGILAGAGLDVVEGEELIKEEKQLLANQESAEKLRLLLSNHILRNRENVVITPHSAFNSREALNRILDTTVENILAGAAGKPLNVVRD
jgi:D-lactate dehydrogenase